jgi:hypothetical protein
MEDGWLVTALHLGTGIRCECSVRADYSALSSDGMCSRCGRRGFLELMVYDFARGLYQNPRFLEG